MNHINGNKWKHSLSDINEIDVLEAMRFTGDLVARDAVNNISDSVIAAQNANALADNVEFWKWMGRNYQHSGIFDSNISLQNYIRQSPKKEGWVIKQLQGKGYEWDWMMDQRANPMNIMNRYDAGDVVNRRGSDVTEINLLNGQKTEYQLKAYTSNNSPQLENTPKDMTVVTNAEKEAVVTSKGYENVEVYKDAEEIKKATKKRLDASKANGDFSSYTFKNVAGTMTKAGIFTAVIGMGFEAVFSYKQWKNGDLDDRQYIKEIAKAGGDAGVTGAVTSGIMIPVATAITVAGVTSIVTIPIAFIVSAAVNKLVAPCFGRGDYKRILTEAKYYQSLDHMYGDLAANMYIAAEGFYSFASEIILQEKAREMYARENVVLNSKLESLYDSI